MSAKDEKSYAEILAAMKVKVNPQNARAEVFSIQRPRREEILLVLKKGDDVTAFEKALDQAVGETVQALWRCADCGGPFYRGRRPEIAQAR